MAGNELIFYAGATVGIAVLFGLIGKWITNNKKSDEKLQEWEKIQKKLEELLEKTPEIPENKEIVIGAVQNGNIILNKKAKKLLQNAIKKWEIYGNSLQSYFIRGFFVIALATLFTFFCIYLWGAAFKVYELIPALKPYGPALFIGFFFVPGYFAGIWILNFLLDLPESPAEEIKTVMRRVEEEEKRTNLGTESSSTDTISLGAAGVEPYATIYGFRHDD